jgi:hypothetical protein
MKKHISKHLPAVAVWFNETPPDPEHGWCEGKPGAGRIIGVRSVLYSDGSAKRWYRMAAVAKPKKLNRKQRRAKKKLKAAAEPVTVTLLTAEEVKVLVKRQRRKSRN